MDLRQRLVSSQISSIVKVVLLSKVSSTDFLEHLNGLHRRIDFTMEKEVSGKLPFLDVLVERKDNRLITDV